jgi:WD40 repeat protein
MIEHRHGRDDALRVWHIPPSSESPLSKALPAEGYNLERQSPWLLHSVLVNTMNFCSFALCAAPSPSQDAVDSLVFAVPGTQDGYIHIHELPSEKGIHIVPPSPAVTKSLVMAIQLLTLADNTTLCLIVGNEAGGTSVQIFDAEHKVWTTVYAAQAHSQPILSLGITPTVGRYYTSSADAVIASHPLPKALGDSFSQDDMVKVNTGHAGQQSLSVRADGRIFATAGWDSKVRIYSAKSLKEVAVLKWHKEGCYAVSFGSISMSKAIGEELAKTESNATVAMLNQETNLTVQQRRNIKTQETHWLAAGSKDGKVSLWDIF